MTTAVPPPHHLPDIWGRDVLDVEVGGCLVGEDSSNVASPLNSRCTNSAFKMAPFTNRPQQQRWIRQSSIFIYRLLGGTDSQVVIWETATLSLFFILLVSKRRLGVLSVCGYAGCWLRFRAGCHGVFLCLPVVRITQRVELTQCASCNNLHSTPSFVYFFWELQINTATQCQEDS